MIICHSLKFVFIHNPKVAGTAMRRAILRSLVNQGEEFVEMHGRALIDDEIVDSAHVPVRLWTPEIKKAYDAGYFFFIAVKDPRKKFVSAMSEFRFQHPDLISALIPIDASQAEYERLLRNLLSYNAIRYDWRFGHFAPQSQFFCRTVLEKGGAVVDYEPLPGIRVFCLENVEDWWETLMKTLGLEGCRLLEERVSLHRPSQPLQKETLSLISRFYDKDFEVLNKVVGEEVLTLFYPPVAEGWKPDYQHHLRVSLASMKSWEKMETFLTWPKANYPKAEGWLLSNIREKNAFENRFNAYSSAQVSLSDQVSGETDGS